MSAIANNTESWAGHSFQEVETHIKGTYKTTDTKNTAGSTNSTGTKKYLIGATEQSANPQTYSNSGCYIGTNNLLYSNGEKVVTRGLYETSFVEMLYIEISADRNFHTDYDFETLQDFMNTENYPCSCMMGTVIYNNTGASTVTVTVPKVPSTYNTPSGEAFTITIPSGGYGEISVMRVLTNLDDVRSGLDTPAYMYCVRGI